MTATGEYFGTASAYTETSLGGRWAVIGYCLFHQIASFAKRRAIVDAIEWVGGKLSAKINTPDKMMVFPRADESGKLRAVSLVNTTVGKISGAVLELDGEYTRCEWRALHVPSTQLEMKTENGSTFVTIPDFDAWSVGTLFVE